MAPRAGKRPVTLSDAFGVEEDRDSNLPKDAKMSRNLGAMTALAEREGGPGLSKRSGSQGQGAPSMYWQQQLNSLRQHAESTRPDGSSAIASGVAPSQQAVSQVSGGAAEKAQRRHPCHTDVAHTSGHSALLQSPSTGATAPSATPPGGFAFCGTAPPSVGITAGAASSVPAPSALHPTSPLEGLRSSAANGAGLLTNGVKGGPLFVCWICRRKFESCEGFDHHVLHSRLHQETIRRIAGLA
mmetsp:Transcript_20087/g.55309  ORF Transcript_20087/g.55309 Transcript_20087/m.55309 type:complete len:242 (-) Transcript_20087:52-777(-)